MFVKYDKKPSSKLEWPHQRENAISDGSQLKFMKIKFHT